MKIAFLSRFQNSVSRGAETFVSELSTRLSKKNEVIVLSGRDSDSFSKITSSKFDVVIPMNGRLQSLKASIGRLKGGYKLVIAGQSGVGRDDILNIVLAKPNVFVALTGFMENWAKKWAWGSKVVKIPNGVDLTKFKPNGEKTKIDLPGKIILSVGALEWYKGHEKTMKAVAKIPEASLLIVGGGSQKAFLENLGNQLIPGRFKIIKLPFSKLPKIYRSADIFTLPSWDREAFGIVYVEAMASGLGVVAPNDLARREIVKDAGILVDVDNPELFAQALKKALSINWKNVPREQAEKFSWDKIAEDYQVCLDKLI